MGPEGYFQNSGEFAIQMLIFAPISYEFLKTLKPWLTRNRFYVVATFPITAVLSVLGASSRGAQIALAVQIVKMFFTWKRAARAILVMVVIGGVAYWLLPDQQIALEGLHLWRP